MQCRHSTDLDGYCRGVRNGLWKWAGHTHNPHTHTHSNKYSRSQSGDSKCYNLFAVFPVKCSILYKWKHQQLPRKNALVQGCCRFPVPLPVSFKTSHLPGCYPNEINSTKLNKDDTKGVRTKDSPRIEMKPTGILKLTELPHWQSQVSFGKRISAESEDYSGTIYF